MKKLTLIIPVLLVAGCSIFQNPVPKTTISWKIGGESFELVSPKNAEFSGLVSSVNTNGTRSLSIDKMSYYNDSNVVQNAYAGAATIVTATGDASAKAFQAGASAAGAALGAAAKAP